MVNDACMCLYKNQLSVDELAIFTNRAMIKRNVKDGLVILGRVGGVVCNIGEYTSCISLCWNLVDLGSVVEERWVTQPGSEEV